MRKCLNCGKELEEQYRICPNCGVSYNRGLFKKGIRFLIPIVAIFLVIYGIFIIFGKGSLTKEAAVNHFYDALEEKNIDALMRYCISDDMLETLHRSGFNDTDIENLLKEILFDEGIERRRDSNYTITYEEIEYVTIQAIYETGASEVSKATVDTLYWNENVENSGWDELILYKSGGKWYIYPFVIKDHYYERYK